MSVLDFFLQTKRNTKYCINIKYSFFLLTCINKYKHNKSYLDRHHRGLQKNALFTTM